ncbi:hypothetical protein AAKU67_000917 [Oxalobacteraceae bacterium GrIS 2.11]
MNNPRRLFLSGSLFVALMFLIGCTTPAIEARRHYTENVSSILISQDKQKLVFIGKTYHYIFDAPPELVRTLEMPFHSKVSGELSNFHVDAQAGVTGLYSLRIEGTLNERDRLDATSAGYRPDPNGQLALSGKIGGTRYLEDTSLMGEIKAMRNPKDKLDEKQSVAESLNKTYTLTITYDPSSGEKALNKVISPIIVSSDGLYLLFNVFLAPVVIPLAIENVSPTCFPYCMTPPK